MTEQLGFFRQHQVELLDDHTVRAKRVKPKLCLCGCFDERHAQGGAGGCTVHRECRRFTPRGRIARPAPPTLVRPIGARDWYRCPPELVRRKLGGWYLLTPFSVRIFIADSKIDSYNAVMRRAGACFDKRLAQRLIAGDANKRKAQRYRLEAAIDQAKVGGRGAPLSATITRVASPRMKDDDNLVPSCKHLRDEIAASLGFDDSRFNIGGASGSGGDIPLFYKQQTAGALRARAIVIDIVWRHS